MDGPEQVNSFQRTEHDPPASEASPVSPAGQGGEVRPRICFLLAIWGKSYIENFCDMSLRTLLAKGNIPRMAEEYECDFLFLTTAKDVATISSMQEIAVLSQHCTVKFLDIADVIFQGNHSATLTLALERGMRSYGDAITDTYFIYLMADYIFSGSALAGLLPHIRRGVSAITAGNYQVIEEDVREELLAAREIDGTIDIPTRTLVAWSLQHLHPVTLANTVNDFQTHNTAPNRLFWSAGENVVVGRFFLRHTLCLRPERAEYVIGASWDYSYLSEFCPSGNYYHFTDSDEYFVVELQALHYEEHYIAPGPYEPMELAASLGEWTTQEQRDNVYIPVIYHADDLVGEIAEVAESRKYIDLLQPLLPMEVARVRGHHYWLSCIRDISAEAAADPKLLLLDGARLADNVWETSVFGPPLQGEGLTMDTLPLRLKSDLARLPPRLPYPRYRRLFGTPLSPSRFHPKFGDYCTLQSALGSSPGKMLVVLPPHRALWANWTGPDRMIRSPLLMFRHSEPLRAELAGVSSAVIYLTNQYYPFLVTLVQRLQDTMEPGSRIHVFMSSPMSDVYTFNSRDVAVMASRINARSGTAVTRLHVLPLGGRRWLDGALSRTLKAYLSGFGGKFSRIWLGAKLALLHVAFAIYNRVAGTSIETSQASTGAYDSISCAVLSVEVLPRSGSALKAELGTKSALAPRLMKAEALGSVGKPQKLSLTPRTKLTTGPAAKTDV